MVDEPAEELAAPPSPSPEAEENARLRTAVHEVIEGFGPREERAPKNIAVAAAEAFMDYEKEKPPPPPALPKPSRRRLDATLNAIRTLKLEPSVIDLSDDTGLGDTGVIELCSALFGHARLVDLRLPRVTAGFSGASAVASVLSVHLKLRRLDMSGNPGIGDEGTASLALSLQSAKCLERLELRAFNVGDAGCSALARALLWRRHHTPLTHLDLSFNRDITTAGVEALKGAASKCAPLKMLSLAGATATPASLAGATFASTDAGKAHLDGSELWASGVHSEFTLRFAPHTEAFGV